MVKKPVFLEKNKGITMIIASQMIEEYNKFPNNLLIQQRGNLLEYYNEKVVNWVENEKYFVTQHFEALFDLIPKTMQHLWNEINQCLYYILVDYGTDWDYPYTVKNAIVFPKKLIQNLSVSGEIRQRFLRTFLHELVHIHQRNHPQKWEKLFFLLGWQKINPKKLKIDRSYLKRRIINPDAPHNNYLWKNMLPMLIVDENPPIKSLDNQLQQQFKSQIPYGIFIKLDNEFKTTSTYFKIDEMNMGENYGGMNNQTYHPAEISAHLIENYFIMKSVFSFTNSNQVYAEINKIFNIE